MAKFKIRPYDDYKAWDTAETIEEARAKRSKLAMSFFSRRVVIVDENENEVDLLHSNNDKTDETKTLEAFNWNGCK